MNVGKLKEMLKNVDDKAIVVSPCGDHSYRMPEAGVTTGLYCRRRNMWSEDHGESITPESEWGVRIPILVFE